MHPKAFSILMLPATLCWIAIGVPLPAHAQSGENYTISGEDGYGIADCMHSGNECGRVIADSWCEAHGHAHAMAFGMGGDVTGSIDTESPVVKVAAGDVVIRCGD